MIAKISCGKGFTGTLEYVLDEDKKPEILAQSGVLYEGDINATARQYGAVASLSNSVGKPVWHASLSFAKEDDPMLNDEKVTEIAKSYLDKMGMKGNQYMVVKHNDTAHQHVHIVINRVSCDGKTLRDNMVMKRSMDASKLIEQEQELTCAKSKGRTFSEKKSREYVYGFKPNKQVLRSSAMQMVHAARAKEFSNLADFQSYIKQFGFSLGKKQDKKDQPLYDILIYKYKYYDNKTKQEVETEVDMKMSCVMKKLSMSFLEEEAKENAAARPVQKADYVEKLEAFTKAYRLQDMKENEVFNLLYYHDINITKDYFTEAVEDLSSNRAKKYLLDLHDNRENYMLMDADLKKKVYQNDWENLSISADMNFSFSKFERGSLSRESIDKFYEKYFEHVKVEVPEVIQNMMTNTRLNNHSINYILNTYSEEKGAKKLPYDSRKVDFDKANIIFKFLNLVDKKKESALSVDHLAAEKNTISKAYQTFKRYGGDAEALTKYLAKRGIKVRRVNKNFEFFDKQDKPLGLAASYYIEELKKHSSAQALTNARLTALYDEYFDKGKAQNYRRLDKREFKAISLNVSQGSAFTLDPFDMQYMDRDFAKSMNQNFKRQYFRSTLKK